MTYMHSHMYLLSPVILWEQKMTVSCENPNRLLKWWYVLHNCRKFQIWSLGNYSLNAELIDLYSVRSLERSELGGSHGCFGTVFYDRSTRTIVSTMLWMEYRPVIKIGPKGDLGSHEIRPIHSAPSLGQSILLLTLTSLFKLHALKFEGIEVFTKLNRILYFLIWESTKFYRYFCMNITLYDWTNWRRVHITQCQGLKVWEMWEMWPYCPYVNCL